MATCSVKNCERPYYGNGYCQMHNQQVRRNGKILERTRLTPNDFIIEGDICKIGCYDNLGTFVGYAIIDAEDVEKCRLYKWHFERYVVSGCGINGVVLHKLISGITSTRTTLVDHKNRNTWDNRKSNLRSCSKSQNSCNTDLRKDNKTGFKGIYWCKNRNKWVARIGINGKSIHLGYFGTKQEAVNAYSNASCDLHGEFGYQKPVLIRRTNK